MGAVSALPAKCGEADGECSRAPLQAPTGLCVVAGSSAKLHSGMDVTEDQMNRVTIEACGPGAFELAHVVIADEHARDEFNIDHADLAAAEERGVGDVLDLLLDNCGSAGFDIVKAAAANGTPVSLNGEDVPESVLRDVLEDESAPAPAL